MDRRTFVKASLATAGAAALATAGAASIHALVQPRPPAPVARRYFGALRVAGPAPVGVPYVPITVRDGEFVAKTALRFQGKDLDVLDWHRFCGRRDAPGLLPAFTDDDRLTFNPKEDYQILTPWFKHLLGEPIRPEHFPGTGFGAAFLWRSHGVEPRHALPGVLLKLDPRDLQHVPEPTPPAQPLTRDEWDFVRREVFHEGFVAVSAVCTHFCCVAGYNEAENLARPRDAWDKLFCTCHNAVFDPRRAVAYSYFPEARIGPVQLA